MANNNNNQNQNPNKNFTKGVSSGEYNLFADEPIERTWMYTAKEFCERVKTIAADTIGGPITEVRLKWYKSDEQTVYDVQSKQNKPLQKVVAEVWIDEDVACYNAASGISSTENPFTAQRTVSKFNDGVKAFISKYCSDNDQEVYKNPSAKFSNYSDHKRCYCIMVDLIKFVNIGWDIKGTGYKAASGSSEPATSFNIDISFVWNDKLNKKKGIKFVKISKANKDTHRELENRDPFISAKKKKKHRDHDDD